MLTALKKTARKLPWIPNPIRLTRAIRKYHLHAYTDARRHREIGPLIIEKGDGIYVEDDTGKRYIEAMAGLWSVGVGFSNRGWCGLRRSRCRSCRSITISATRAFAADRPHAGSW